MKGYIAFFVCFPVLAQAAPDWAGAWSYDLAWCVNASKIGSVTPAPILLSETEMLGYENSCDIVSVDPLKQLNGWEVEMSCYSEGDVYENSRLLMLSNDQQSLWIWDGGTEPALFGRCP